LHCWFGAEAEAAMRGVMERDWWGRGVYWQIIGEVSAGVRLIACRCNDLAFCWTLDELSKHLPTHVLFNP
jgi:hypothetical protein